ncbi:ATP-binding protein [Herbiconiux sp. KACC 21604]|uniref:sensor histidine kinase n=1 Tax=unclassified Herbiconiux TaxID=2618217 RepID=UPI001492C33F|nr:ATP-binding protein [Herbiconiux sp. SALV-R1]QJU54460.1 ATP-binding protein [Herbiconiux sp. SALV-R1]WPO85538.1 ATP-binding protein [Herbiconiux sp. KACC 21604]
MPTELPGPRTGPPRSRERIDRTLARMEGLFGFVFAVLSIPVLNDAAHTLKPEWGRGIAIALFGSILLALVCSLLDRGVKPAMGLLAGVFLVCLALWPFAVRSPDAALGTQPWLWYIVIVAIVAAAISFSTLWAAVYAVGVPVVFAVLRVMPAGGGADVLHAVLDAGYSLLLGVFAVIVVTMLRATATRVDAAQRTAMAAYAEVAKRHATENERTRVDTVIHDRVLSTLLAAARSETADERMRSVQMAERALVALQSAEAESDGRAPVALSALAERLHALVRDSTPEISFSASGELSGSVPARVMEGVYSAAMQALENSVQHAGGAGVLRSVSLHAEGGGFTVVVADTGAGFDPAAVPADRLGVRISIRERVGSVGGSAEVRSAPGEGTSVVIDWPAEPHGTTPSAESSAGAGEKGPA